MQKNTSTYLPALFLACRLALVLSLPLEGLRGYGDLPYFFNLAALGRPFFDLWMEYPPLFPFLSRGMYLLSGGAEHVYDYLLVLVLSLFQAGTLYLFARLAIRLHGQAAGERRAWVFFAILTVLAYGWWNIDAIAAFFLLLGLVWLLERRDLPAGIALGLGALTKLFPALLLAVAWRYRPLRRAALATVVTLGLLAAVYAGLYLASPNLTAASLRSQNGKGSWETPWALLDGNLSTGVFGTLAERDDPAAAGQAHGNPARVPPLISLAAFGLLGLALFWKASPPPAVGDERAGLAAVAFAGLTWCIFLLWSPGWSPQWLLYLLPLLLLALPERTALLGVFLLVFVNLLEWPILLSRGYNWGLFLTIPIRTLILILMSVELWGQVRPRGRPAPALSEEVS